MAPDTPRITIAIPTYNRAAYLKDALDALIAQTASYESFEVIVVNNASTDDTEKVAREFASRFPFFQYIYEPRPGASFARNTALHAAKTRWVCFLDDDAQAAPDYATVALRVCGEERFLCFGGAIKAWRRDPLPLWFLDEYESDDWRGITQISELPPGNFANAGNMVLEKNIALDVGGFDTSLGPRGDVFTYGEETELQIRLRAAGVALGYVPDLIIRHCAKPERYTLKALLITRYKGGAAWQLAHRDASFKTLGIIFFKMFLSPLKGLTVVVPKLATGRYRWQNVFIEVVGRFFSTLGRASAWYTLRFHSEK